MKTIYFPNLNGIRFIAAFMVVLAHIEQTKSYYGQPFRQSLYELGALGVTLFFVLSGFLITYLLLAEGKDTGDINLKHFYIRRILRIWPLYYMIVLLSFYIIPNYMPFMDIANHNATFNNDYVFKLLLFLFMCPNIEMALYPIDPIPFGSQAWSIGVEEQFYLIWPLIIKYVKSHLYKILCCIIILFLIMNVILAQMVAVDYTSAYYLRAMRIFVRLTRIDCMAIGGIGALLLINNNTRIMNIIYNKKTQLIVYAVLAYMLIFNVTVKYINHLHYSLIFIIIILNLAANKCSVINLENKYIDYLGKISYGIYMYHLIAIYLSFIIIYKIFNFEPTLFPTNLCLYLLTSVIVITMSMISYELFEKLFLKKKVKFSAIVSGDNARTSIDHGNH